MLLTCPACQNGLEVLDADTTGVYLCPACDTVMAPVARDGEGEAAGLDAVPSDEEEGREGELSAVPTRRPRRKRTRGAERRARWFWVRACVACCSLGLLTLYTWPPWENKAENRAVAFVKKHGGSVARDETAPGKPVVQVALRRLEPGTASKVTDADLKELAALKGLTSLDLSYTQVTDAGLKELAAFKNLTSLHLDGTNVTDEGLKGLAPLKHLTYLILNKTQVTDRTLAVLREINLLHALTGASTLRVERPARPEDVTFLDLHDTQVTDAGLKELATFKNLTYLSLSGTKVTDEGLKELAAFTNLTHFNLWGTKVTGEGLKELAPLTKLTTLQLDTVTDRMLAVLREINLLHALFGARTAGWGRPTTPEEVSRLELGQSEVTDAGVKELAPLKNLVSLDLYGTKVTDEGLKALAALKNLTSVNLYGTKVTDAGVKELQKALPKCKIMARWVQGD